MGIREDIIEDWGMWSDVRPSGAILRSSDIYTEKRPPPEGGGLHSRMAFG